MQAVKIQMQNELLKITEQVTKNLMESTDKPQNIKIKDTSLPYGVPATQSPLLELLNATFDRFQQVIASHSLALCGFARVIEKYNIKVPVYEVTDVWNNIQAAVRTRKITNSRVRFNMLIGEKNRFTVANTIDGIP